MHLFTQLASAALLTLLVVLVHGAGVLAIGRQLRLGGERGRTRAFHIRTVAILGAVALMLFALHTIEIALFAAFFLAVGAIGTLEEALFFSASAYSTLGQPGFDFPLEWRLLGAIEGVIGFLMLGWSTAFFVTDMNKLLRE